MSGMQEAIDGFLAAPAWVQVALAFFALTFVAMVVGPRITQRRVRQRSTPWRRRRALLMCRQVTTSSPRRFPWNTAAGRSRSGVNCARPGAGTVTVVHAVTSS